MPTIRIARAFHVFNAAGSRVNFAAGQAVRLADVPATQSPFNWLAKGLAKWTAGGVVCALMRWARVR